MVQFLSDRRASDTLNAHVDLNEEDGFESAEVLTGYVLTPTNNLI